MTPHALLAPARLAGAPLLRAQSDERLVDLVRAGNDAAFEAIVARYRRPLLRYCSGFMSETRAEDAVQTAFVSAFSSLRSSQGDMDLRPWLYRIVHNNALNALRDRTLAHEELSEELDGVERPDQAYENSERFRDVLAAVQALPDRQRDAVVLREMEGRSYEEIASDLGVSNGSVRQLLNRARNTLRSGITAITPWGLLARVPWGAGPGESVATRVGEICAGGTGAAALTKVCATAMVTGAVVGGVASSPTGGIDDGRATDGAGNTAAQTAPGAPPDPRIGSGPADPRDVGGSEVDRLSGSGHGEDRGSSRGRGGNRGGGRRNDDRDDRRGERGDTDGGETSDGRRVSGGPGEGRGGDSGSSQPQNSREFSDHDLSGAGEGGSSGPGGGGSSGSGGSGGGDGSLADNDGSGSGSSGSGSGGSGGNSGPGSAGSSSGSGSGGGAPPP